MYIHKLKIGNVELENNILLAPMAGITDLAFRKICKEYGNPGLVYTEMASSRAIFHNDEKTKKLLDVEGEKRPIAVQIFGNDPKIMAFAASKVSEIADIIDINMGCPAPKVVKNGDGSKLLLNPELIGDIVQEVVKTVEKPVTVKMRKGWDKNNINAVEVAKIIEQAGASAITIHGRTREEYYSGRAGLDIIKQVKESVNIPVIGNGDIKSIEDANKMFEYCNVDGIMIGRATIGNPWIINDIIKGEKREISNEEKLKVLKQHIELAVAEKGEYIAVREMRKHICWYIKNLKESSKISNLFTHLLLSLFAIFIIMLISCMFFVTNFSGIGNIQNQDSVSVKAVKLNKDYKYTLIDGKEIFNEPESEYYVLLYKKDGDKSKYYTYINEYAKYDKKFYFVDLNDKKNKFLFEKNDLNFTVNGDRLLKVKDKEYDYFVNGKNNILKEMKNDINSLSKNQSTKK